MNEQVSQSVVSPPQRIASFHPAPVQIAVLTNKDLCQMLSWKSVRTLTLLGLNKRQHYSKLFIRKKGAIGKLRILHNPDTLMRSAQYKILRAVLDLVPIPEYIHAFERGRSIPSMASLHVGQSTVISIDLKDFFTSIKQVVVQGIFQHLGIGEAPARTLSELCTYGSFVPQGALTSPKLSNIVSSLTFGPLLNEYCKDRGYVLSIYADDITISFKEVGEASATTDLAKDVIDFVTQCVSSFGFRVNKKKTKVMRPHQRQYVCGVVVNKVPNLQQKERRKLRAIVHNCQVNGLEAEALKNELTVDSFRSRIGGRINWYKQLNNTAGTIMQEKFLACN